MAAAAVAAEAPRPATANVEIVSGFGGGLHSGHTPVPVVGVGAAAAGLLTAVSGGSQLKPSTRRTFRFLGSAMPAADPCGWRSAGGAGMLGAGG